MNEAKPASTATMTPSMARIPRFIALASGESLWPKQTGHASAGRATASRTAVSMAWRMGYIPLVFF
jgi:hypothetical protein